MAQLVTIAWTGADGQTYNVSLDATLSQVHESANTVTEHPVESGANMSDHIRPDLDTLSLEGVISNTPVYLPADNIDGARETDVEVEGVASGVRIPLPVIGSLVGNIPTSPTPKGVVRGFEPAFDRIGACYAALLTLHNEGVLCRVVTHVRIYESMAIRRLGVTLSPETGHALPLSMEFVQIRIGSTEEVPVPEIPRARKDKGSTTPTAPDADVSENASALFNAFG
jgi:hypothetical protein